ncbi:MAG: PorT family protein [Candidatus Amulumruptor caecigallinarius]|nr:PorT family protein [Candidatus Amulumruptor caecigallinarius]MCM1396218.1 PorT family protein [Candidatus Amulumruptor caecigallinarius]MCM1453782.1 PorT family protein [bacterium]
MTIKSIKRIVATAFVAVASLTTLTPSAASQMRWGATAGVLLTDLHFKQSLVGVSSVPGFAAGISGEMMFPGVGFGIDLGAQYEMRGAEVKLGEKRIWASQGYGDTRFYLHYLNIPLHLRFKYTRLGGFEDILAPLVYVGPSFGFMLGHSDIDAFSFPLGEIGLNFGIGAEIKKRWQVTVEYNLGMTYCTKDRILTDYSAQNREWKLAATYFF